MFEKYESVLLGIMMLVAPGVAINNCSTFFPYLSQNCHFDTVSDLLGHCIQPGYVKWINAKASVNHRKTKDIMKTADTSGGFIDKESEMIIVNKSQVS